MMRFAILCLVGATLLPGQPGPAPTDSRGWLNLGVRAFKNAEFAEAVSDFQKAVDLEPNDLNAHLYLGTAYMTQFIPGAESSSNLEMATKADAEFQRVLAGEPGERVALQSLASLHYQMAQGINDQDQKSMRLDESAGWYRKLNEADPSNKEGWYSLAVIGWNKVYPARVKVRKQLGMRPDDPGPIPNAQIREDLRARNGAAIDDGIANLERALQIDPAYDDAMAYLNLMYRERADLEPSKELWARDTAMADQWVQKSLEEKKRKAQQVPGGSFSRTLPPPAPNTPNQIRVSGNVQAANLIRTVDPIYPELARSARIQGTVRFQVTIDDQGRIANAQLVSGHPLLVAAAQEALRQWLYKPTLLNVTVITVVDVNFTLPPGA